MGMFWESNLLEDLRAPPTNGIGTVWMDGRTQGRRRKEVVHNIKQMWPDTRWVCFYSARQAGSGQRVMALLYPSRRRAKQRTANPSGC